MELRILLVEPNESLGEIIAKNFEREFGAKVTTAKSASEAIDLVKSPLPFDVFVVRNYTDETPTSKAEAIAALFLNIIYDKQLKTPLIVIGEFEHTYKKYALVSEKLRVEELSRLVLKALNLKKEDFSHLKLPDYVPFPIKYFYLMNLSPCDVYIKLIKKTGDEFVKRLHFGESFSKDDLHKYEDLGLKELYIYKDEHELFMNGLITQSLKNLRGPHSLLDGVVVTGDSFDIVSDLIKNLGINPASVALVDQTLLQIKSQITKTDKLSILLKKLLDNQLSFSYRRSYMICLITHMMLPKMEWGRQEQLQNLFEKISLVSFFHDIYLEDEKLLRILSQEAMKKANLSPRERDAVLNHANNAALLVQTYPHLPQGVDTIIKQHHGVSNGVGFPEVLTASISPMAIFFIVIEDFVTQILEQEDFKQLEEIIIRLKAHYQLPTYRKVVTELEGLFLKRAN